MRSKNAFKNILIYLLYEVFVFALGIIFPRFFILSYGSEVNGLTSTITKLLSLINLIQAGAVGAAIYQMYKPVANNDYETQSAILYSSRRFYNRIASIYLSVALAAGVFYGFYLASESLTTPEIILSFVILALNGSFEFFFTARADVFLSPHQKKYCIIIGSLVNQVVRYSLTAIVLVLKLHFLFLYVAILLGGACGAAVNMYFYRRNSKGLITRFPKNKAYPIPDRKYLLLASLGTQAITASPSVIITTILGLKYSSVFSIYFMVYTSLHTILNSIQLSISAIFGNVVASEDSDKISGVYDMVSLATFVLGAVLATCAAIMFMPFVAIYTSGVSDFNYIYPALSYLIVLYIALFTIETSYAYVATVYGYFKQICKITLACGAAGILVSIAAVALFGMPYVMTGLIVNILANIVFKCRIIRKNNTWFSLGAIIRRTIFMAVMITIGAVLPYMIKLQIVGWIRWFIHAIIIFLLSCVCALTYCLLLEKSTTLKLFRYFKKIIKRS